MPRFVVERFLNSQQQQQQNRLPSAHVPQHSNDISLKWNDDIFTALWEQRDARLPLHLRWRNTQLQRMDGVWLFSFSLIWGRVVELFCPGPISPRWGVLTKCLAYSKAASDPFVYSLLRHQYRKTCSLLANKILRRSPLNSSSNTSNVNATSDLQAPVNKTVGQWEKANTSVASVVCGCPTYHHGEGGMWLSATLMCFWRTLEVGSDFGNTRDSLWAASFHQII